MSIVKNIDGHHTAHKTFTHTQRAFCIGRRLNLKSIVIILLRTLWLRFFLDLISNTKKTENAIRINILNFMWTICNNWTDFRMKLNLCIELRFILDNRKLQTLSFVIKIRHFTCCKLNQLSQ